MVAIGGVEGAEFFEIFKFVDHAVRLQIHTEWRRLFGGEEIEVHIFPVVLLLAGRMVGFFEGGEENCAKVAGQIDRPVHHIGIPAADFDRGDELLLIIM